LNLRRADFASCATLCAIAAAAYVIADIAHEGLGHGGACFALGGRILLLNTTFEDCNISGRLIDGAGPTMGVIVAFLALGWLRLAPPRAATLRIFLCLVFAFAIFWNVGYLIKSGVTASGDWHFVIAGLQPSSVWHAALAIVGVVFYGGAMRLLGNTMERALPATNDAVFKPVTFASIALLVATVLSALAAADDARGSSAILTDALPSSLASIGFVWTAFVLQRRAPDFRAIAPASRTWIAAGLVAAIFFVGVLGPGVRF
jgi:hypothetical protein